MKYDLYALIMSYLILKGHNVNTSFVVQMYLTLMYLTLFLFSSGSLSFFNFF